MKDHQAKKNFTPASLHGCCFPPNPWILKKYLSVEPRGRKSFSASFGGQALLPHSGNEIRGPGSGCFEALLAHEHKKYLSFKWPRKFGWNWWNLISRGFKHWRISQNLTLRYCNALGVSNQKLVAKSHVLCSILKVFESLVFTVPTNYHLLGRDSRKIKQTHTLKSSKKRLLFKESPRNAKGSPSKTHRLPSIAAFAHRASCWALDPTTIHGLHLWSPPRVGLGKCL